MVHSDLFNFINSNNIQTTIIHSFSRQIEVSYDRLADEKLISLHPLHFLIFLYIHIFYVNTIYALSIIKITNE